MAYYSAMLTYLNNAVAFSLRDIQLGSNWPLAASYFFLTATRQEVDRVRTIIPSGIYKSQPQIGKFLPIISKLKVKNAMSKRVPFV